MFKIIGAVLIISVSAAFGIRASEKLRQRYKKLYKHYLFIGEAADKMRLGADLSEIYSDPKAREILKTDGYTARVIEEGLKKEDFSILTEFYSELGMGDLETCLARCDSCSHIVKKHIKEAEDEVHGKARLYSILGFFSGLFIAILLM